MVAMNWIKILTPLILLSGCATVVNGTNQDVTIASTPSSAEVWVDSKYVGLSPTVVKLARSETHTVKIALKGYLPYEVTLTKELSGWVFGNLVFGGLIGLAVDGITGSLYQLTPKQVQAEMRHDDVASNETPEGVYVSAVMIPDSSWIKIGELTPLKG
jgi:hypothetical protein